MKRLDRPVLVLLFLLSISRVLGAQESELEAQLRGEKDRVVGSCGTFSFKTIPGCGYTLFTDQPFHVAAGSLPPQNGFGVGAAFVWTKNTRNWRLSWDADAVASTNFSWRAGAYMKIVHTPHPKQSPIVVIHPGQTPPSANTNEPTTFTHPYTFYDVYAQTISLNDLNYFGLGNDSPPIAKSVFGMTETIVGVSATKPVFEWAKIEKLHLTLLGEANGRFVRLRPENGQSSPSIGVLYDDLTAPGLTNQPGFAQLGEGVRIAPDIGNFEFDYLAKVQQFFAPLDSHNSFLRWTLDLNHTYFLREKAVATNAPSSIGPDACSASNSDPCPPIPHTFNNTGSIGVRLLLSESITSGSSQVPFYFQPTLGGQDLNSSLALGSYQDYRFRAPNVFLLQETFEHSVWGPFGLMLQFDEGQVALTRGDFGISNFKHSYAAGVTVRAGAFPMVYLLFAWGGPEGTHSVFNMNTSLLGGAARPSLF